MSVKSIKLNDEISDTEFVALSMQARKGERNHLLGLLRIQLNQLKNESVTTEEIYASLEAWIHNRELITNSEV